MKFALKISLLLFALFLLGDKSLSLSDYQIKRICKKNKIEEYSCFKNLQKKKLNLEKGNKIEIPVIPYAQ